VSFADRPPPVRLVARRIACQNTKLRVYFDHIAEGDRQVIDYAVVTSIIEPQGPIVETGVTVMPVDKEGRVGLQRVWRHPIGAWTWEAPRGFIDDRESARAAASRELQEEAGLCCAPESLIALGSSTPEAGIIRARNALFAAAHCTPAPRSDDDMGLGSLHWFALEDALAMADASEIEDSTTLAVLYRFARRGNAR